MKKDRYKPKPTEDGTAARDERAKETQRQTRNPRAAVRRYCEGNRWLEENARAVGNLD